MAPHYHYLDCYDIQEAICRYAPPERTDYQRYLCYLHDHRNIAKKISRPLRDGHYEVSRGYKVFFDKYGYATHCRPIDWSTQTSPYLLSRSSAKRELENEQDDREDKIIEMIRGGKVLVEHVQEGETTIRHHRRSASVGAPNARVRLQLKYC